MSLVGTRPPTLDEWEKYELHHRARLAIKPGITGMWQVSGRSDITDFEEVVKLDMASWFNPHEKKWHAWQQALARKIGFEKSNRFFQFLPIRTVGRIYQSGLKEAIKRAKGHF